VSILVDEGSSIINWKLQVVYKKRKKCSFLNINITLGLGLGFLEIGLLT